MIARYSRFKFLLFCLIGTTCLNIISLNSFTFFLKLQSAILNNSLLLFNIIHPFTPTYLAALSFSLRTNNGNFTSLLNDEIISLSDFPEGKTYKRGAFEPSNLEYKTAEFAIL